MGLSEYYKEANKPAYVRIGNALNLSERTATWDWLVQYAETVNGYIEGAEYGYKTSTKRYYEKWLAQDLEKARNHDRELDDILNQLQVALGEDGQPLTNDDLVLTLFFDDPFSASKAFWLDEE